MVKEHWCYIFFSPSFDQRGIQCPCLQLWQCAPIWCAGHACGSQWAHLLFVPSGVLWRDDWLWQHRCELLFFFIGEQHNSLTYNLISHVLVCKLSIICSCCIFAVDLWIIGRTQKTVVFCTCISLSWWSRTVVKNQQNAISLDESKTCSSRNDQKPCTAYSKFALAFYSSTHPIYVKYVMEFSLNLGRLGFPVFLTPYSILCSPVMWGMLASLLYHFVHFVIISAEWYFSIMRSVSFLCIFLHTTALAVRCDWGNVEAKYL